MKILVVADSAFGNTWAIANAIADAMGENARVLHPAGVAPSDLKGLELLVVGSPTQGGRPLPSIRDFVNGLPDEVFRSVDVAAFDTRVEAGKNVFLKLLIGVIGFAAPKIDKALVAKGGHRVAPPEGFIVTGKEGPLDDGEVERAAEWARALQPIAAQ